MSGSGTGPRIKTVIGVQAAERKGWDFDVVRHGTGGRGYINIGHLSRDASGVTTLYFWTMAGTALTADELRQIAAYLEAAEKAR